MNNFVCPDPTTVRMLMFLTLVSASGLYCSKAMPAEGTLLNTLKKPVSAEQLGAQRGARDLGDFKVLNLNDVRGSVQNNSAIDVVTGSNMITNGAFSNVTGFPLVVQNTGNNVLIQNSTILNIGLQP